MNKYLVIGNPIEHSLSPLLHNYWIKKNNLKASHTEIVFFQLLENLTNNYILFNNNGEGNNKYFEFTPSKLIQNSLNTNQLNFNQKAYKFLNINTVIKMQTPIVILFIFCELQ